MNEKQIFKIIAKKTNSYLKFSIILFILSLILLSNSFLFVQQQHKQLKKDFVDNANTHLITVNRKIDNNSNITQSLTFSDEQKIQELVGSSQNSYIYSEYSIGFGMCDENDNNYFIKGIDNEIISRFNIEKIGIGEALSNSQTQKEKIVLQIPIIDVENGGFTSHSTAAMNMQLIPLSKEISIFDEFDSITNIIFVNTETLQTMISTMFETSWESFKHNYDEDNPYGMELIESIHIYIDDLNSIKSTAKLLKTNGYEINYVLGAFEDLQNSLTKTYSIYGTLLLFILIISGVNIIISFSSYLCSMQKDMGIFRHYGYSASRVYNIYKSLIIKPYIKISIFMLFYTLILSMILLQSQFLTPFILTFVLIMLFIGLVLIILLKSLHTLCKKNIIVLLQKSKEFE